MDLKLEDLSKGMEGMTGARGRFMAECAAICLESQLHSPGVNLPVSGSLSGVFSVLWSPASSQQRRSYNDLSEATEHGAYAVAILVIKHLSRKQVVQRSRKGSGFDFWIADGNQEALPFQGAARLEVSGILDGTPSRIRYRLEQKVRQTTVSDGALPAYVAVVEFRGPSAQVVIREQD